jgi:uncharacterized membrane protein
MACASEWLADVELFERLDDEERARLAQYIDVRTLRAGEVLFHAGQPGEAMYIVKRGEVELFIKDHAGQHIRLTVAGPGAVFGELALLDAGPRTATALALEDCELLELDREDLLVLFKSSPEAALALLAAMTHMTRKADELLRQRVARNVNDEVKEHLTTFQRIADAISAFSGSMAFLLIHAAWFAIWIGLNTLPLGIQAFDPFPFGLLTMVVSLEAIFLSCVVLLSQNRQSEKDRVRADIEYEVNVKAELEVAHLHEKTDQIYSHMLEHFARIERRLSEKHQFNQ